jgi:hypothetical protein
MIMHELYQRSGKSLGEAIICLQLIEELLFIGLPPGVG